MRIRPLLLIGTVIATGALVRGAGSFGVQAREHGTISCGFLRASNRIMVH